MVDHTCNVHVIIYFRVKKYYSFPTLRNFALEKLYFSLCRNSVSPKCSVCWIPIFSNRKLRGNFHYISNINNLRGWFINNLQKKKSIKSRFLMKKVVFKNWTIIGNHALETAQDFTLTIHLITTLRLALKFCDVCREFLLMIKYFFSLAKKAR